jgi:hypothetical protein
MLFLVLPGVIKQTLFNEGTKGVFMSSVGELIDAYCLRCKLTLSHVVLFEVGGTIQKVKCRTCGAEHKYRGLKPGSSSGATPLNRTRARQGASASPSSPSGRGKPTLKEWTQKMEDLKDEGGVRTYSLHGSFSRGDVIRHPTFGIGFVEKVLSETRMDVIFQDALRRMAMNMATP